MVRTIYQQPSPEERPTPVEQQCFSRAIRPGAGCAFKEAPLGPLDDF